jgi:DNA modification methylase
MLNEFIQDHHSFTNEEKRVETYVNGDTPTIPSLVNDRTPLSKLNLNWREKELPERERTKHVHRLHPYLGKFIPQLVEIFLRKYFKPGQTVFDPFSGSGTTLVQAKELGINSVGCDVSAFNVLLARAKTKMYSVEKVKREVTDILELVHKRLYAANMEPELPFLSNQEHILFTDKGSNYLNTWFAPQALSELLTFRDLISNYEDQEILKVILCRAARSARLTTHFDLDFPKKPQIGPYHCYKHRRICQPTLTAFQFLKRYSLDTVKRIEQFSILSKNAAVNVIHGDSRHVDIGPINGVITSPPYVGLIDYHEQHRYAYELLGIKDRSDLEIGPASKGTSMRAKKEYQELIIEVFRNALQYMPKGGRMIVVAADRHNLYAKIAEACNVKIEAVVQRHVNRRTGMRADEFYESVFIWQKK